MRKIIFGLVVMAIAFFLTAIAVAPAGAHHCAYSGGGWLCTGPGDPNHQDPPVDRLGGADRYETAALIAAYDQAPDVSVLIVANGEVPFDALAAGPHLSGPMVLVPTGNTVPQSVLNAAYELAPERVIVLGGTAAVSDEQVWAIRSWAYEGSTQP